MVWSCDSWAWAVGVEFFFLSHFMLVMLGPFTFVYRFRFDVYIFCVTYSWRVCRCLCYCSGFQDDLLLYCECLGARYPVGVLLAISFCDVAYLFFVGFGRVCSVQVSTPAPGIDFDLRCSACRCGSCGLGSMHEVFPLVLLD